jgi:hypothetical protein
MPAFARPPSSGVRAPFSEKSGMFSDHSPATSGGCPLEVARRSLMSTWLTERNLTSMRFWLRLKSSITDCIDSASNPLHFSQ